jgi:lysophospholipase L1-like esterase
MIDHSFCQRFAAAALALMLQLPVIAAAADDERPVEDAARFKLDRKENPALPTIYLIGDSTVRVGSKGQRGWGDELAPFFDLRRVNGVNHAIGGRSSRTFQTEGRWDGSLSMIQKGDFVVIQFGHNDSGPTNDNSRARGTLRGTGEETEEIDNMLTGKHEVVHTYGWYLRKYIRDVKAKGAVPIICSLIPRKSWKDGKMNRASGSYGGWAREVATQEGALFVDLNEIIASGYEKLGPEKVDPLFADAHTHTTVEGARFNAECVVAGLKGLPGKPLDSYLSPAGKSVSPFDSTPH